MRKKGIFLTILFLVAVFSIPDLGFFRSYYFVMPIEFLNSYQIPCAYIEIEKNRYLVEIDLGSKMALSLHKGILENMQKTPCGTSRRLDFRGNKYETPLYCIPQVKAGSFLMKKTKAREESLSFATKGSIIIDGSKECIFAGRLGRDFFADKNLFLDFNHGTLIACSKLKDLGRKGYELNNLIAVPFKSTSDGLVVEVETDLGKQRLVIDTGATASVIRSRDVQDLDCKQRNGMTVIETSKFAMGGTDFGLRELYLIDLSPEFNEIDGLLGMDFLKEHVIYLDFARKTAYIRKSLDMHI